MIDAIPPGMPCKRCSGPLSVPHTRIYSGNTGGILPCRSDVRLRGRALDTEAYCAVPGSSRIRFSEDISAAAPVCNWSGTAACDSRRCDSGVSVPASSSRQHQASTWTARFTLDISARSGADQQPRIHPCAVASAVPTYPGDDSAMQSRSMHWHRETNSKLAALVRTDENK